MYPCNISKYLVIFLMLKTSQMQMTISLLRILQKPDLKHCITGYSSCKDFTTGGEHAPKREKY